MSNSPLVEYTLLSPNRSSPRNHAIDTITIHCMAGNLSVETCGNVFAPSSRQASSNYGIGTDGRIALYCHEANRSWCTSSADNDNRAITIEVANDAGEPDWHVSDAALASLIKLCADICSRNNIKRLLWKADKTLIGKIDQQNMTIHRWLAAKACVPIDSEVLTRDGWVTIGDIKIGDEIACPTINDLSISFERVYDKVPFKSQDTYTNNGLTATKDHRIVYMNHHNPLDLRDGMRIEYYNNLLRTRHPIAIPMAGYYNGEGLDISDDMLKLIVAVQADGHYMYEARGIPRVGDKKKYYGLEFHLKKDRKIKRIIELLNNLSIPFTCKSKKDSSYSIRIYNRKSEGFNIVDICEEVLNDKKFTWDMINMSPTQARIFLSELLLWDGCVDASSYHSKSRDNINIVSAIASMNGVGSNVSSSGYDIIFRQRPYMTLGTYDMSTKRNHRSRDIRNTTVTCVSVKTGIFLMRQHGKTIVIGNCPGDYLYNLHGYIADEVNKILEGDNMSLEFAVTTAGSSNEEIIWNTLKNHGLTDAGVAGVMGNLYAESGLIPNNLQNTYEATLGFTDEHYTDSVDNGSYMNFVNDSAGYGLAQWTWYTRKQGLYDMAKSQGKSIGDLGVQLDWLWQEFGSYGDMMSVLRVTTSVREASDIVLIDFENPGVVNDTIKAKRAEYGQVYFDKYANTVSSTTTTTTQPVTGKGPTETTGNPLSRDWKISSGFQTASRPTHNGVDLVPADGVHPIDVHAVWSGTITKVDQGYGDGYYGCTDGGQLGNHVIYKTDDGHYVLNGHMLKDCIPSTVVVGARINAGDKIGTMGTSGSSTGKHLHYEIRTGTSTNFWSNTPIDPNASLSQGSVVLSTTTNTTVIEPTVETVPIVVQKLSNKQVAAIQTKREQKTVLDLKTGLKFNVSWAASATYHSDWTPMTSADTDVIKEILKQSGSNCNWTNTSAWSWNGRPGVLFLNDNTYVACGFHLRPHAAIMGGNPGSPFTNQSNVRPATRWALGGHMCMYYGDSIGGTPSCNTAANEAEALGNAYFQGQTTTVTPSTSTNTSVETSCNYTVRVTTSALNYRSGPGTNNSVAGTIRDKGIYTIIAEATGQGATKWGKLKSGAGWISLDYASKL